MSTEAQKQSTAAPSPDQPGRVVEAPLYSLRWARFFAIAGIGAIALGLWISFIAPHLVLSRAEEICARERALPGTQQFPQILSAAGSACFHMLEIQHQNPLSKRAQTFVAFLSFPIALFYLARRLGSRSALDAARADQRPPVLYLRSFGFDVVDDLGAQRSALTEETRMVADLEQVGPVLAIGRPGEKLARLGAARLYLGDNDWQAVAEQLMASVRLVVIRAGGDTPGLRWELARARDQLPAEKVVLWFPRGFSKATYTKLRDVARETLRVELPEAGPKGYVTFDAAWQPKPAKAAIGPTDDLLQPRSGHERAGGGRCSLQKLLEQLEAKNISPPPFRIHAVAWVALALWLVFLWLIPGERWSFGLEKMLALPHFVGTILEGAIVVTLAIGLAFIPYIRNPARSLRPSLVLCAILALHAYWLVVRTAG